MGIFGFQQVGASSNHYDTNFNFFFGNPEISPQTDSREKLNNTSAYIKPTNISGGDSFRAWVSLENGMDVSGGHHYNVYQGQEVFLINYAVETYGVPVKVRIQARKTHGSNTMSAEGVWSPDSI